MHKLRIVFMGTPDFAVPALSSLHQAGHEILAVYCQAPKPAGRGHKVQKTPVHIFAEDIGVPVHTPKSLRNEDEQKTLAGLAPDVIVVAAYGLILPQAVLDIPRLGCVNIHGSLLPRWRGAAPIHRSILAGDTETGITIMMMEAGLDTGPMLLKGTLPITRETSAQSLHDAMSCLGGRLIVDALEGLAQGTLHAEPQPEAGVTYADKLKREDGIIDWSKSAVEIERQVRALNPWPSTFFTLKGEVIKVLHAEIIPSVKARSGTLVDTHFTVACGEGALRLLKVQRAGKGPTDGAALLRGLRLDIGALLS